MRECGIKWSSGAVALATAGHLKELVALLALLSTQGEGEAARAAILAAACAVMTCEDAQDEDLAALKRETRERLGASSVASTDVLREPWEALSRKAGSYGRLFASVHTALRDAYLSAGLDDYSNRERRVFEDLGRWATSVAERNARLSEVVEPRFSCRARLDQRKMSSAYEDALHNFARSNVKPGDISFDDVLRRVPARLIRSPARTTALCSP